MSVDFALGEWTEKDSAELDAWIRTVQRPPLQFDPAVAELLEPLKKKRPVGAPEPKGSCKYCERPFRPRHTLVADYPGTVTHGAKGVCATCQRAIRRGREPGKPHVTRPDVCLGCSRPLRARQSVKDVPGTVEHHGRGYCRPCHRRVFKP